MNNIVRNNTYNNSIIVIDGMWRCGKSLLTPLVGALDNVDKVKFDYHSEWIAVLHHLKKIDLETTSVLLKMYADLTTYNNFLGREINIRPNDDSGIFKNPKTIHYLKRIFKNDSDEVSSIIEKDKPIQLINTHNVYQISRPFIKAFSERMVFLRCVRNPISNIEDWADYFKKVGEDPREMNFYLGSGHVPWFVSSQNQEKYDSLERIEKAALMYIDLESLAQQIDEQQAFKNIKYLEIPFENLTKNPDFFLSEISKMLGIKHHKSLIKYYKKLNLPRKSGDNKEYANNKNSILKKIKNKDILDEFSKLVEEYESKYSEI